MATNSAFARLVARPVDRVQLAASRVLTRNELSAIEGFDVSPGDAALVVSFLSRGPMTWDEIRVPLRYFPEERARARLEECVAGGVVTFDGEIIAYTAAGTEAALAALDARAAALQVMWSNSEAQVSELLTLLAPVAAAAVAAGTPMSGVTRATLGAPNPTPAGNLWRLLTTIRRHRSDCHAEAWAGAGYTVEGIVALADDASQRQPIENRTNELNADIWGSLLQDDQLACMAALAALDGSGTPATGRG